MDSVKIAGWIAIGVSLVLVARVLMIDNPEAIIIVAPALIGGVAVVAWPSRRSSLVVALVLIGATAVYSLIGWIGFSTCRRWSSSSEAWFVPGESLPVCAAKVRPCSGLAAKRRMYVSEE
jgi:hypothetical protein